MEPTAPVPTRRSRASRALLGFTLVFALTFVSVPLAAQNPDPAGHWKGGIVLPAGELGIAVHLTRGDAGWAGTIDIPAQGLQGFTLSNLAVDGTQVHFEMAGVPGTPTFDGTLDEAGEAISGTFTQGGQSLDFSLARASEEEAERAEAEGAFEGVPGEGVVGHWLGRLQPGPVTLRLALEVTAGPEGALRATLDSLDQGTVMEVETISFDPEPGMLRFEIPQITGSYEGTLDDDGSALQGTWSQAGQSLPLTFHRQAGKVTLKRPQEPRPPFPYQTRDVTFPNESAGIELAGTLVTPEGEGPFPAVVFVSGSGPQDRDEALMGHRPFLVLADHLARRGIASLRYDDRGVGGSGGDHMGSTVADFAGDARAAIDFLAAQSKIDRGALGILGHSEGGLTGPRAALAEEEVDFLVLLAPPGVPLPDLLERQAADILRAGGMSDVMIEQARTEQVRQLALVADPSLSDEELAAALRERTETLKKSLSPEERAAFQLDDEALSEQSIRQVTTPWFRSLMREDPADYLGKTKIPVLALFGGKDIQVAAEENAAAVLAALDRAGNGDVTVRTLPGLNHLFQRAETGTVGEYGQIEETFAPDALELISGWIVERFGASADEAPP